MSRLKLAAVITGIAAPFVFLAGTIAAVAAGASFSPANGFLTELGMYGGTSPLALVFNIGLIVSGLAMCAFMVLWGILKDTSFKTAVAFFGIFAGAALAAQGVFNIGYSAYHYVAAAAFFVSVFLMCGVYIAQLILTMDFRRFAIAGGIAAFLAGALGVVFAVFILTGGLAQVFYQDAKELARQAVLPFAIISLAAYVLTQVFVALLAVRTLLSPGESIGPGKESGISLKTADAAKPDTHSIEL